MGQERPKKRGIIPNYAEDLPRPNQPGEPVHPPMPAQQQRRTSRAATQQEMPQQQRRASVPQQPQPQQQPPSVAIQPLTEAQPVAAAPSMGAVERRVAHAIASAINDAVMRGDEPEEFVANALQNVPKPVLVGVCQKSTDEVIAMLREIAPQSAGATPGGQKFVRQAIRLLREQLGLA